MTQPHTSAPLPKPAVDPAPSQNESGMLGEGEVSGAVRDVERAEVAAGDGGVESLPRDGADGGAVERTSAQDDDSAVNTAIRG